MVYARLKFLVYIIRELINKRLVMKKKVIVSLSLLLITAFLSIANASTNKEVSSAIKLYKTGNYSECYSSLKEYMEQGEANVLAYYYLAISATQVGKKDEALSNYQKVLNLAPKSSSLYRYAFKGKSCLEEPQKCNTTEYTSTLENFITNNNNEAFTEEVKSKYEQLKIEQLMREINRSKEISPDKFKEYKDFSSYNNLLNLDNEQNTLFNSLNPQLIETLLTNNLSSGF